ncbi:FAM86A protein [Sporothrix schenckii 1099-18]|uniref:FAM86A protein n=1 Tax=Sporothrix schenckii 1099-18 TaxID=1397361 RepID=A0A0F2M7T8_SPOSC|nr:FAM86A protein [Sporothrix schenckii 1099-18]KJR85139.1 FAM86A protein [Sporothrix schenckii 1099-18]
MDSNAPPDKPPTERLMTSGTVAATAVQRFCRQCLQAEPSPDFPGPELLRQDIIQEYLYAQLFAPDAQDGESRLPPAYALRVLKTLVGKIEDSIDDWDEHGISDNLMGCLANSHASGSQAAALADAVKKNRVVYYVSALETEPSPSNTDASAPTITLFENRATIAAAGTTGIRTWEAALHLGAYLCKHRDVVAGKRVLELGAGTGYVSILCAKHLGAAACLATDGSPEVVEALPANVQLNGPKASVVEARELYWGPSPPADWTEWSQGGFDTILGADITFDARDMPDLLATIRWCLSDGVNSASGGQKTVIIAATERNRKTFQTFVQLAAEAFDVEDGAFPVPPRASQAGPFYSDAVPIHICRLQLRDAARRKQ